MPAKPVSINLIGQDTFEHTPQGRIVAWALTYGRYIMIGTEIVVLLAFISRFSLDRKLTDLKEEIDQKQAILQANLPLENHIKTLLTDQSKPLDTFKLVNSLLPADVYLRTLSISSGKLSAEAIAGTTTGFALLLNNFQSDKRILAVEIDDIKKDQLNGINFRFSVQFTKVVPK
jgi:Tfp pilus assembly protein PilN